MKQRADKKNSMYSTILFFSCFWVIVWIFMITLFFLRSVGKLNEDVSLYAKFTVIICFVIFVISTSIFIPAIIIKNQPRHREITQSSYFAALILHLIPFFIFGASIHNQFGIYLISYVGTTSLCYFTSTRLQSAGMSKWLALLIYVPIVNLILVIICCAAPPSRGHIRRMREEQARKREINRSSSNRRQSTPPPPFGSFSNSDSSRVNNSENRFNWSLPDENLIIYRLRMVARNDELFNEALRRVKESFKKIEDNVIFKYAKETELYHGAMGIWTMHYLRSTGRSVGLLDQKLMEWLVQRARRRGGHAFSSMLHDLGSKQA